MGDDIDDILLAAWARVRETLRGKPDEVRRRLIRGREMWRKRPPRAWCIVLRAADRRITPMNAAVAPEHGPNARVEHTVTLDVELIRQLCAPVRVHEWGEGHIDVARRLGRERAQLVPARARGVLNSRYYPPDRGCGGKPRTVVSSERWLDPNQALCRAADPVWGWTGKLLSWRVPDMPPQTLLRVPLWEDRTRQYADARALHPEHPLRDPPPPAKRTGYKLAPPPPDFLAWYKWKDGEYLGYDWRNPAAKAGYERRQSHLESERARSRRRWAKRSGRGGGSKLFKGWLWLCPTCGRRSKVLYYPLPPVNVLRGFGCHTPDDVIEAAEALDPSLRLPLRYRGGFACNQCLHVRPTSRVRAGCWGECVCYLTCGLLGAREVPRPAWFTPDRRRAYTPHVYPPSKRRPQVEQMLLAGRSYREIAAELGIGYSTVATHAMVIYRNHGVRGVKQLLLKLKPETAAIHTT